MCCLLCIEIAEGRMSSDEAFRAATSGELQVDADHAWEVVEKIEEIRKREEDEMFKNKKD